MIPTFDIAVTGGNGRAALRIEITLPRRLVGKVGATLLVIGAKLQAIEAERLVRSGGPLVLLVMMLAATACSAEAPEVAPAPAVAPAASCESFPVHVMAERGAEVAAACPEGSVMVEPTDLNPYCYDCERDAPELIDGAWICTARERSSNCSINFRCVAAICVGPRP